MAELRVIIFGILAVCCSAHFGYDHRFGDFARQQQQLRESRQSPIDRVLGKFGVRADDQKCFTLAKRPFYMTRLVKYPCSKQMPGVPVAKSFMTPFGPMCMSYFRERVYRFYKIHTCCPGYGMDKMGKCSIRLRNNFRSNVLSNMRPRVPNMFDIASRVNRDMWQRARDAMNTRRNMLNMNFNNIRKPIRIVRPSQRSVVPPFMDMYNVRRDQPTPKMAFLRFNRFGQPPMPRQPFMPRLPPMPRPVPRPPMTRMVKIMKARVYPGPMLMMIKRRNPAQYNMYNRNQLPQQLPQQQQQQQPQQQQQQQQRQIPSRIMSNRAPFSPFRGMPQFHPGIPQIPTRPMVQRVYPQPPPVPKFPQIPESSTNNQYKKHQIPTSQADFNQMHTREGFNVQPQETQSSRDLQVNLPEAPVEMPGLIVEEGPMNPDNGESCIKKLEVAVQTCLKQSNIDVPDIMTAFEPFNDDVSLNLCRAENAIFKCIENELKTCTIPNDAIVAQDMLAETAETVRSMCELREVSVATETEVVAEDSPALSSTEGKTGETIATVESVDAIPSTDNKQSDIPAPAAEDKPNTDKSKPTQSMTSAEAMQEAIQHEVHVQEMRMKEYLLPILIGSGLGFFVIVLLMSLLVCCCCKRKMKKKMRVARELEKPPLKDADIYTIGVAPPVYEVNGIPPMYYEEAKGEKISSREPSIAESADEVPEADITQM